MASMCFPLKSVTVLIAHVWNKFTVTTPLLATSKVAYIELAKEFCPKALACVAAL